MRERKRQRLAGYDYANPGAYFVTVCVCNRECMLGSLVNGAMVPNQYGQIVLEKWLDLPKHYSNCELDECIVMPNHFHGIIIIRNGHRPFPTDNIKKHGLPDVMRGFKTFSSHCINATKPDVIFRWQKSYYDHIIRDEEEMKRIRQYIQLNPLNWETDRDVIDIF
jgi:putative transposase